MTEKNSEDVVMLTSEEDGSWSLRHYSYKKIHSNHARLLDALYARETVLSGVAPPYGRWWCVNNFPEDLEPIFENDLFKSKEYDPKATDKVLRMRDWEYEELLDLMGK